MENVIKPIATIKPEGEKLKELFKYVLDVEVELHKKYGRYNPITHEITVIMHTLLRKSLNAPEIDNHIFALAHLKGDDEVVLIVFDAEADGVVYHVDDSSGEILGIPYERGTH